MNCRYLPLKEFANIKGGKRLPQGKLLTPCITEHPYIRVRDLGRSKVLEITSECEYIDNETHCKISHYIVHQGDIIISIVGTIGLVAKIGKSLNKANLTENCAKIVDLHDLDADFLYYYLSSDSGQDAIKAATVGAVQAKLPLKNIKELKIPYFTLSTQKAIADVLSCLDDKIELNNRINKNLEAQAQAIFNEWFFRKDTQNNWGVLGDIADINPSRKLAKGTVARYIEMSNLASTTAFPLGWEEKSYSGGAKFQNGDTLLARITPCLENGKGAYINFLQEGEIAFGSTEYIVITGKKGYCNEFFYFLIRYLDFQLYAAKSMTGSSGRQRVSADSIASYKMPIPSLELCEKFHEIAEQVMTSNCNRSLENRTLSILRDTLLPKLMSGEIQIPQEV